MSRYGITQRWCCNSVVDFRKGQYRYQTRNIAHNNARLYCLNTTFGYETDPSESEPEAADGALALFLKLDGPATAEPGQAVEIRGLPGSKPGRSARFRSIPITCQSLRRIQRQTIRTSASQ
jgi:hypothetical protein